MENFHSKCNKLVDFDFVDYKICSRTETVFNCHKCVISRCIYLKTIIKTKLGKNNDNTIKLELSDNILSFLLIHIYTGTINSLSIIENDVYEIINLFDAVNMWFVNDEHFDNVSVHNSKKLILNKLDEIVVNNMKNFIEKDILCINEILTRFCNDNIKTIIINYFHDKREILTIDVLISIPSLIEFLPIGMIICGINCIYNPKHKKKFQTFLTKYGKKLDIDLIIKSVINKTYMFVGGHLTPTQYIALTKYNIVHSTSNFCNDINEITTFGYVIVDNFYPTFICSQYTLIDQVAKVHHEYNSIIVRNSRIDISKSDKIYFDENEHNIKTIYWHNKEVDSMEICGDYSIVFDGDIKLPATGTIIYRIRKL